MPINNLTLEMEALSFNLTEKSEDGNLELQDTGFVSGSLPELSADTTIASTESSLSPQDIAKAQAMARGPSDYCEKAFKQLGCKDRQQSRFFGTDSKSLLREEKRGLQMKLGKIRPKIAQKAVFGVRNVWEHNLDEEIELLSQYLKIYNIVVMDTEYPGVVCNPGEWETAHLTFSERTYEKIRLNVLILKLIQLGITLMDKNGNTPPGISSWQFNFEFDLETECHSLLSIDLLIGAGLEFDKHATIGIKHSEFAEKFLKTGIMVSEKISWVVFQGAYDLAYLLKMLSGSPIPDTSEEFFEAVMWLFPKVYDVKYMIRYCNGLTGGLQRVSQMLNIKNVGIPHQAGSDAHLTGNVFIRLVKTYFFKGFEQHLGQLHGFDRKKIFSIRKNVAMIRAADKDGYNLAILLEKFNIDPASVGNVISDDGNGFQAENGYKRKVLRKRMKKNVIQKYNGIEA